MTDWGWTHDARSRAWVLDGAWGAGEFGKVRLGAAGEVDVGELASPGPNWDVRVFAEGDPDLHLDPPVPEWSSFSLEGACGPGPAVVSVWSGWGDQDWRQIPPDHNSFRFSAGFSYESGARLTIGVLGPVHSMRWSVFGLSSEVRLARPAPTAAEWEAAKVGAARLLGSV